MSSKAREIATTYARDIAKDRTQSLVVSMFDGTNDFINFEYLNAFSNTAYNLFFFYLKKVIT